MMFRLSLATISAFALILSDYNTQGWVSPSAYSLQTRAPPQCHKQFTARFSSKKDGDDSDEIKRTSFDEAGKSLIDEEDQKRMEMMGDYDLNPDGGDDKMERMRAAIRARTADLGIEKSKVSADYIQQRQQQASSAGSARAAAEQSSADQFGGLDLSQISDGRYQRKGSPSIWGDDDEDTPSMFFDPEERLTEEERAEIDPVMKKGIVEQAMSELQNAKWPSWTSALREVILMAFVVVITGALIIGWDKVLRGLYTDIWHFVPTKEEIANYASRFDGLDLPKGWTDNMNEDDVARFADSVNSQVSSFLQEGSQNLPDL